MTQVARAASIWPASAAEARRVPRLARWEEDSPMPEAWYVVAGVVWVLGGVVAFVLGRFGPS
jgi:hypothetical protein